MKFFYENRFLMFDDNIPMSIYRNENFNYLAHWHTDIEIAYIENGNINVGINNERRLLKEGDIAISSSGDIHYYESRDPASSIIVLVFKPELFDFSLVWPNKRRFISPFASKDQLHEYGLDSIKEVLDSILLEKQQHRDYYDLLIRVRIIELCVSLLRVLPTCSINSKEKRSGFFRQEKMQQILTFIEENYVENISLDYISECFNMNPFNLSKMFNAITGTNFKNYINTLRIAKAENMIQNSSTSLTDIALECGFNSIRTFNRVYKNMKGCPPSDLRRKK